MPTRFPSHCLRRESHLLRQEKEQGTGARVRIHLRFRETPRLLRHLLLLQLQRRKRLASCRQGTPSGRPTGDGVNVSRNSTLA